MKKLLIILISIALVIVSLLIDKEVKRHTSKVTKIEEDFKLYSQISFRYDKAFELECQYRPCYTRTDYHLSKIHLLNDVDEEEKVIRTEYLENISLCKDMYFWQRARKDSLIGVTKKTLEGYKSLVERKGDIIY